MNKLMIGIAVVAVIALIAVALYFLHPATAALRANGGFRPITAQENAAISNNIARKDVISGNPEARIWIGDRNDGMNVGVWESTPGKWHFANDHWEYCRIISGVSIITEEGGEPRTVKAGDSFVLRRGFKGTWEVLETTRKDYVIKK